MATKKRIIAIGGLSGAGKSSLTKEFEKMDFLSISISRLARDYFSKKIKNFSYLSEEARNRKIISIVKKDPYFISRIVKEIISQRINNDYRIVLDGVRSINDVLPFFYSNNFSLYIIFLTAPFSLRLKRIEKRDSYASEKSLCNRDLLDIRVGILDLAKNSDIVIRTELIKYKEYKILAKTLTKKTLDEKTANFLRKRIKNIFFPKMENIKIEEEILKDLCPNLSKYYGNKIKRF